MPHSRIVILAAMGRVVRVLRSASQFLFLRQFHRSIASATSLNVFLRSGHGPALVVVALAMLGSAESHAADGIPRVYIATGAQSTCLYGNAWYLFSTAKKFASESEARDWQLAQYKQQLDFCGAAPGNAVVSSCNINSNYQLYGTNPLSEDVMLRPTANRDFCYSDWHFTILGLTPKCPAGTVFVGPGMTDCAQSCSLKLTGLPAEAEPGKQVDNLQAEVICNGAVTAKTVQLRVRVEPRTGGHAHHDDKRPPGTLSVSSGGSPLTFSFIAPGVAGDHTITAECEDKTCGTAAGNVRVGIKGLESLPGSNLYYLIPNTNDPSHPDNHYLTSTAILRLTMLAHFYRVQFPAKSVLQMNDASLERGGYFDIKRNWGGPHYEHCRGTAIDIRANGGGTGALNITSKTDPMIGKFQNIGKIVGANPMWEVPKEKDATTGKLKEKWDWRHFHTQLMGQEGLECP